MVTICPGGSILSGCGPAGVGGGDSAAGDLSHWQGAHVWRPRPLRAARRLLLLRRLQPHLQVQAPEPAQGLQRCETHTPRALPFFLPFILSTVRGVVAVPTSFHGECCGEALHIILPSVVLDPIPDHVV